MKKKAKRVQVDPKAPRIEVGSPEMRAAFEAGVEHYVPTAGGHEMAVEAGCTMTSQDNLRILTREEMCGKALSIELGPNHTVLVRMGSMGMETYLATGFAWGYGGEGPRGLAEFAASQGFGEEESNLKALTRLPHDFKGVLFSHR